MSRASALQAESATESRDAGRATAEPAVEASAGNQSLQALLARGLRAKLEVGGADDPEEHEADRLADQVLSGPVAAPCACGAPGCSSCGGGKVRRKAEAGAAPPAAVAAGFGNRAGRPLDLGTRRHFEPRFGADFAAVRIHDDAGTHRVARGIGARAFAIGHDIGFAEGRNRPGTAAGDRLLAHELAHVALGHGGARRTPDGGGRIEAPEKPPEAPKETTPIRPGSAYFRYRGVVVADDAEFMRGELRRLVAQVGLEGAFLWVLQLAADEGKAPEPGVLETLFSPLPRPRSPLDAMKDMQVEQTRKSVISTALPTVKTVFMEVANEAMDFLKRFELTGISITQSVLTSSEAKVEAERLRYGLQRSTEMTVSYHRDGEGGTVPEYDVTTTHGMENQLPGQGLAGAAKDLLAKRKEVETLERRRSSLYEVHRSFSEFDEPEIYIPAGDQAEFDRLGKEVEQKRLELTLLEGVYQERYPILARVSADTSALEQVAQGPSAKTAEILNEQIFGTLENIQKVRAELHPGGDVKIWKLPDIVSLAKSASGCNDSTSLGRMRNRLVNDKVQQVEDDEFWRNLILGALTIGLALLAAIPSGGSSLVAGATAVASMGAFALSAFQAAEHLNQYMIDKAMAGTDLDRARAIGASDPSLFWLAVDIVGAIADLGPALKASKAMLTAGRTAFRSVSGAARRVLSAGPDTAAVELANLRKIAQEAEKAAGIPGLASRVVGSAERLGASGASVEKTLASAAGHEAAAVTKAAGQLEKAVAKGLGSSPTRLGGHTVSVTPGGWLVRCSNCGMLRAEFATELGRSPELTRKILDLEKRAAEAAAHAADNPALAKQMADQVAAESAAVADKLEAIRRTGDIRAYRGVDLANVDNVLLMDERLVVEMPFVGKGAKSTNSEGWLRSQSYYWEEILKRHPNAFSEANKQKILGGPPLFKKLAPQNDPTFQAYFPQYDVKGLRGKPLIHHHVGGGGQAAAVPGPLHPGSGGIHTVEKQAGVWGADEDIAEMLQRLLDGTTP